ncbi:3-epi-6-deoxocathasterone 23-monooxygenase-like, partial [Trifolium medium]|nr:3-epi-6-deoxocathasterone 23-monooxygenase-like [Trifolium medium]
VKKENKVMKKNMKKGKIPKGNKGWPLLGETLDFIACGYTSNPVSFMEKRKSL